MAQAQISDLRQTAGTLRKQIPGDSATAVAREDRAESRKSVQELSAMEREAEELLKRVREEKNAALKQKTRGKKSRRRLAEDIATRAAGAPIYPVRPDTLETLACVVRAAGSSPH